jgi:hypothetical protein
VRKALNQIRSHYRGTQLADGSWNYRSGGAGPLRSISANQSMICAGLIGLGVSYGLANESSPATEAEGTRTGKVAGKKMTPAPDANRDPVIRLGLIALASVLEKALAGVPQEGSVSVGPGRDTAGQAGLAVKQNVVDTYFLFSLERVAVAYGLDTIGKKDWYAQGSAALLPAQNVDGSWRNTFVGDVAGTSFALLFLKRANLAPDLSGALKGRIKDPGVVRLTAGGVGGGSLKSGESKPITGLSPKPDFAERPSGTPRQKVTLEEVPQVVEPKEKTSSRDVAPEPATVDREAARLSADLLKASPERQRAVIAELEVGKGVVNTLALASAIPKLSGSTKQRARDALAERLARMTAATLRDKLRDDAFEVRRAGALACAMKEDKSFVPDLIKLLGDPEPPVSRAAHVALKTLTGHDFGPRVGEGDAEVARAVRKWEEWWASHK